MELRFSNPIACAACGIQFYMTAHLEERRRADNGPFHCPNGHQNVFGGKESDLNEQIISLKKTIAVKDETLTYHVSEAKRLNRRINSLRGVITRLKRLLEQ